MKCSAEGVTAASATGPTTAAMCARDEVTAASRALDCIDSALRAGACSLQIVFASVRRQAQLQVQRHPGKPSHKY